jgi:DNA-binding transcriptional MerR regulator
MLSLAPKTWEVKTMEKKTFSISSVYEMAGVSKNRIREWHDKGLLRQVQWIPVGTRNHRRFT